MVVEVVVEAWIPTMSSQCLWVVVVEVVVEVGLSSIFNEISYPIQKISNTVNLLESKHNN